VNKSDLIVFIACMLVCALVMLWIIRSIGKQPERFRVDFDKGPPLRDLTWSEARHCQDYFGGTISADKRPNLLSRNEN
jgi:hypothetical protein